MPHIRTRIACVECSAVHLDRFANCRQCGHELPQQADETDSAISLTRRDIKALRVVFRQALNLTRRDEPTVQICGHANGLRVRCANNSGAVEWFAPGNFRDLDLVVPWALLADCEGNQTDSVHLERHDSAVLARWCEGGIDRVRQYETATLEQPEFPVTPELLQANDPALLVALREAMDTVDRDATRYATNCVQLDGKRGRVAATDSRQLLMQDGFDFPWDGEILVPQSKVFSCSWLPQNEPVRIGATEDWLTLIVGAWTMHLRLETEGRFPDFASVVPDSKAVSTRLNLDEADAAFLAKAVNRLPAADDVFSPVTLDLNGQVLVRATADDQPHPTELLLTNSDITGSPLRLNTDRTYLRRAVQLGFRQACFSGPETPVLCEDARRRYVWMALGKGGAVERSDDANRIASPVAASTTRSHPQATTNTPVTPTPARPAQAEAIARARLMRPAETMQTRTEERSDPGSSSSAETTATAIDEAETLRGTLQAALTQTRNLITALKRQRKQSKTVQSALASLRQLQNIPA